MTTTDPSREVLTASRHSPTGRIAISIWNVRKVWEAYEIHTTLRSIELGLLPANGQQLLQHKVGLLPGNGQELALKDLKNPKGRSQSANSSGSLPEELADCGPCNSGVPTSCDVACANVFMPSVRDCPEAVQPFSIVVRSHPSLLSVLHRKRSDSVSASVLSLTASNLCCYRLHFARPLQCTSHSSTAMHTRWARAGRAVTRMFSHGSKYWTKHSSTRWRRWQSTWSQTICWR